MKNSTFFLKRSLKIPLLPTNSIKEFVVHHLSNPDRKIGWCILIRDPEIVVNRSWILRRQAWYATGNARDGHGRRIDISFSGTTRYSAACFCPPPPSGERSHSGQLKSDPRRSSDRWSRDQRGVHALFFSRVSIVSFFFPPFERRLEKKELGKKKEFRRKKRST